MKPDFYSRQLAETIMKRYPDPVDFPYRPWCYSQGFMLWGMIRLWESTQDQVYLDYVLTLVNHFVSSDGSLSAFRGDSMDDMMAGSLLVWAWTHTRDDRFRKACDTVRRASDNYPRTSDGTFWHGRDTRGQVWVDGLFMGQMFLAKYGRFVGDAGYCFDECARQISQVARHCRKHGTGLMLHAWSEDRSVNWADPETGLSPEVWSEGLGWYALILVETLDVLPPDHTHRPAIVTLLQKLLADLRTHQDPRTGLWYQVVDKGMRTDNWHDTSGSAMFVYAIRKALELGLADPALYASVAGRGYEGIVSKIVTNAEGLVDVIDACDGLCVQPSYDAYVNYPRVVNAKEAVGAVLWATGIVERLGC